MMANILMPAGAWRCQWHNFHIHRCPCLWDNKEDIEATLQEATNLQTYIICTSCWEWYKEMASTCRAGTCSLFSGANVTEDEAACITHLPVRAAVRNGSQLCCCGAVVSDAGEAPHPTLSSSPLLSPLCNTGAMHAMVKLHGSAASAGVTNVCS